MSETANYATATAARAWRRRALVALASAGALALLGRLSWTGAEALPPALAAARGRAPAEFADEASCAECHQAICAAHAASSMGRDWSSWRGRVPLEDAPPGRGPAIAAGDRRYQVEIVDGRHFQREFRIDPDGTEVELNRHEAKWVVGSGHLGRTYLREEHGFLFELPVSWFSQKRLWDLTPGFRRDQPFGNAAGRDCIGCHSGGLAPRPGAEHAYDALPERGIGCQRCHGPAAGHVAAQRGGAGAGGAPLVRLGALAPARQQDICLRCHSVPDQLVLRDGRDGLGFRPGDALADHRVDFHAPGKGFMSNAHAPRSMASKCYTASAGAMTCVLCHDPHRPAKDFAHAHYNAKCDACHQQTKCSRPLGAAEAARGGDCVACHMPRRPDELIAHAAATEHWIRKPNAKPPAGEAPLLRPLRPPATPLETAEAETTFLTKAPRLDPLPAALRALEAALEQAPRAVNARIAAGTARAALGFHDAALAHHAAALALAPDDARVARMAAVALLNAGNPRGAELQMKENYRRWPWLAESDADYAALLAGRQAWPELLDFHRNLARWHPAQPRVLEQALTATLKTGGDPAPILRAGQAADGAWPDLHVRLAFLAAARNDASETARHAAAAVRADPRHGPAHAARAEALRLAGRLPEARAAADEALRCAPNHPHVLQVWRRARGL